MAVYPASDVIVRDSIFSVRFALHKLKIVVLIFSQTSNTTGTTPSR